MTAFRLNGPNLFSRAWLSASSNAVRCCTTGRPAEMLGVRIFARAVRRAPAAGGGGVVFRMLSFSPHQDTFKPTENEGEPEIP